MNVFDASALLVLLQDADGAEVVERELQQGGVVGAANWFEVAQKVLASGGEWSLARALLLSYPLQVEPVGVDDAELAAALWRRGAGLSLADRLCRALGLRLDATVWTADTAWGTTEKVRQVRTA